MPTSLVGHPSPPSSPPSSPRPSAWPLLISLVGLLAAVGCDKAETADACTEIGCEDGFALEIQRVGWEEGSYTLQITADGRQTSCSVTIPLPTEGGACDRPGYLFETSGSELDVSEQAITGLFVAGADYASLTTILSLDGVELASETWTPTFEELQPNGPDCEPTCESADDTWTIP